MLESKGPLAIGTILVVLGLAAVATPASAQYNICETYECFEEVRNLLGDVNLPLSGSDCWTPGDIQVCMPVPSPGHLVRNLLGDAGVDCITPGDFQVCLLP